MNSERSYDEEMEDRYQRFKRNSRIPDDFKYVYSGSSSSESDFDYTSSLKAIKPSLKISKDQVDDESQKECENASATSEGEALAPNIIMNQPITESEYLATPDYQCNFVRCSRKFMSRGSLNKHLKFHAGGHNRILSLTIFNYSSYSRDISKTCLHRLLDAI